MNSLCMSSKWSLFLLLSLFLVLHVQADEVTIQGDIVALTDIESTYYVSLDRRYPSIFFFGYEFDIETPTPLKFEVLGNTLAKLTHKFSKVPSGSYVMNVQVYIYFLQQKAWKVGENTITIQITDTLDDFLSLVGKQDDIPIYTPVFYYIPNKTVLFTGNLISSNSILNSNFTKLDYSWSLSGPNSSLIHDNSTKFSYNFTSSVDYTLNLEVTANITPRDGDPVIKKGKISKSIKIRTPLSNVNVNGNNFVKNGSLLDMNITCNGSANYQICYFFTDSISNKSCFDSAIVVTDCFLHVSHYFPENGTQYLNYAVRNDVSDQSHYTKITIYKIGPKPSLIFVILPLASSFLVIIIILIGIAHHIKQRRRMNATIEVATMENFGLYGDSNSLTEKSFFERIQGSVKSLFHRN